MLIYGLLWVHPPLGLSLPTFPPHSAVSPHPPPATTFSKETLKRRMPCTEWVKANCRNLVQCGAFDWELRQLPRLSPLSQRALSGGAPACPCAQMNQTCARGQTKRLQPCKCSFNCGGFLFKIHTQIYFPLGLWWKKSITSEHFSTIQILGAF